MAYSVYPTDVPDDDFISITIFYMLRFDVE